MFLSSHAQSNLKANFATRKRKYITVNGYQRKYATIG